MVSATEHLWTKVLRWLPHGTAAINKRWRLPVLLLLLFFCVVVIQSKPWLVPGEKTSPDYVKFEQLLEGRRKTEMPTAGKKVSNNKPETVQAAHAAMLLQRNNFISTLIFLVSLKSKERTVFSQNGEDGVLDAIFQRIGVRHRYYVEFGVENGTECNTRFLREKAHWRGLMMDGTGYRPDINLRREKIFPANIVRLFRRYKVPKHFDLLSVDTDFKDFWILLNILNAGYRPRVIVVEVNSFVGPWVRVTVPLETSQRFWDGTTNYFGCSVNAVWSLGRHFGYSMVYCESRGVNCFLVIDGEEGLGDGVRVSDFIRGPELWSQPLLLPHEPDDLNRVYFELPEHF